VNKFLRTGADYLQLFCACFLKALRFLDGVSGVLVCDNLLKVMFAVCYELQFLTV